MTPPASPDQPPAAPPAAPPGLLRRLDPTVLPILAAALVLLGAVAWLLGRPLPQPGADEAAEQGMRGTRRDTEQPREQIPQDAADEAGEDDRQAHRPVDPR